METCITSNALLRRRATFTADQEEKEEEEEEEELPEHILRLAKLCLGITPISLPVLRIISQKPVHTHTHTHKVIR
jgi:hypothetical protein